MVSSVVALSRMKTPNHKLSFVRLTPLAILMSRDYHMVAEQNVAQRRVEVVWKGDGLFYRRLAHIFEGIFRQP